MSVQSNIKYYGYEETVATACHSRIEPQLLILSLLGMKLHATFGTCMNVFPLTMKVVAG